MAFRQLRRRMVNIVICVSVTLLWRRQRLQTNHDDIHQGEPNKSGPSCFAACNLEVFIASTPPPNLAQVNVLSFLTSPRNLLEKALKNKVAPSIESQ